MKLSTAFIVLFCFASLCFGQTIYRRSSGDPRYEQRQRRQRHDQITELRSINREFEKTMKLYKINLDSAKEQIKRLLEEVEFLRTEIKNLQEVGRVAGLSEQEIKACRPLRDVDLGITDGFTKPLQVGHRARLNKSNIMTVSQIIDHINMVITLSIPGHKKTIVWVTGIDTSNLVDERTVTIDCALEVVGTRTYANVIGSTNTVFILEPLKLNGLIKQQLK